MEVNRTVICDEVKGTNINGKNEKKKQKSSKTRGSWALSVT